MGDLRIVPMIITMLEYRGGLPREQNEGYVCRRIVQYWDMKGNLCFEYDPAPEKVGTDNKPTMTFFQHPVSAPAADDTL